MIIYEYHGDECNVNSHDKTLCIQPDLPATLVNLVIQMPNPNVG